MKEGLSRYPARNAEDGVGLGGGSGELSTALRVLARVVSRKLVRRCSSCVKRGASRDGCKDGVELGGGSGVKSSALKALFMHILDVWGSSRNSWDGVLWYGSF